MGQHPFEWAVFSFHMLFIMHGHNRQQEIIFLSCFTLSERVMVAALNDSKMSHCRAANQVLIDSEIIATNIKSTSVCVHREHTHL